MCVFPLFLVFSLYSLCFPCEFSVIFQPTTLVCLLIPYIVSLVGHSSLSFHQFTFIIKTILIIKKSLSKSSSFYLSPSKLDRKIKWVFLYLLRTNADVESFKARFNIPRDVNISYCHEGDIEDQRLPHVVFFPLMSILDCGVRFLVDQLLLRTFSFYELSLDQSLPNFYRVVNCIGRLN